MVSLSLLVLQRSSGWRLLRRQEWMADDIRIQVPTRYAMSCLDRDREAVAYLYSSG